MVNVAHDRHYWNNQIPKLRPPTLLEEDCEVSRAVSIELMNRVNLRVLYLVLWRLEQIGEYPRSQMRRIGKGTCVWVKAPSQVIIKAVVERSKKAPAALWHLNFAERANEGYLRYRFFTVQRGEACEAATFQWDLYGV